MRERRTTIQLVVTGDLEEFLPTVLGRLFPEADFPPVQRALSFTATLIGPPPPLPPGSLPDALKGFELMSRTLAAIDPGAHGNPADYAIAIDDVEVENRGNESAIVDHVRFLLGHLIERGPHDRRNNPLVSTRPDEPDRGIYRPLKTPQRRRDALRERCSFHLMAPMIEAPFFADFATVRSGLGPRQVRAPDFDPSTQDCEQFVTGDPGYLAPPDNWKAPGATFAAQWARANRQHHPKHYLEYLLDPGGIERRPYREKVDGLSVLSQLNWDTVFSVPSHATLLRSLIDDVASMCGVPPPRWAVGDLHPLTQVRKGGLLRNIA